MSRLSDKNAEFWKLLDELLNEPEEEPSSEDDETEYLGTWAECTALEYYQKGWSFDYIPILV